MLSGRASETDSPGEISPPSFADMVLRTGGGGLAIDLSVPPDSAAAVQAAITIDGNEEGHPTPDRTVRRVSDATHSDDLTGGGDGNSEITAASEGELVLGPGAG